MNKFLKHAISGFLAFSLFFGMFSPAGLTVNGAEYRDGVIKLTEINPNFDPRSKALFVRDDGTVGEYKPNDTVRVSIVLKKEAAIDKGYPIADIANNKTAVSYRRTLENDQKKVVEKIEKKVLGGKKLEVAANLTLVANLISADVKYSNIEKIEKISGVKQVVIERVYKPFETADSDGDSDSEFIKAVTKYTGAGVKIAIIDSGVNHDHEAFDPDALNYSLRQSAPDTNGDSQIDDNELASYKKSLGFMTKEDVLKIAKEGKLHATANSDNIEKLYLTDKVPFAYNYCDNNLSVKNTEAGYHGSHVSGIAAANTYLDKDGQFVKAAENGGMTGTAPDAQILNLKVMGAGSCTDSTLAIAIEDAVLLGADVMNLSLGMSMVGSSCAGELYGGILDNISSKGILMFGAIGNDGSWLSAGRKLYADDVNLSTATPPSSYSELVGVAWANKNGVNGERADLETDSAYGIPSSLMLQPEITSVGTKVNSVNGKTDHEYAELSGTSMASPGAAGAAAVLNQYVTAKQANFMGESFLLSAQKMSENANKGTISAGLLMSTADPMHDAQNNYYSLLRQGAGLLNTKNAALAKSFIEVSGQPRGRVKAEVGDSPDGSNTFSYTFTLNNVSNKDISYTLKTDLFTEDTITENGNIYLADKTRKLIGKIAYKIGDKTVDFASEVTADVDGSGSTDYDDAIALLDFLTGKRSADELNLTVADVDGDGKKTTYDAYLILSGLETSSIAVKAGSSVTVRVDITVTENLKETYKKGAYLEGFTYVEPTEEGADVTHSIPILGFCGNWSDPSMFDRNSYIESQNKMNNTVPYTKNRTDVYDINYLEYQDHDGNLLRQSTNPFSTTGDAITYDRLAMGLDDSISNMKLVLIRPAGAICFAVMKKDAQGSRKVVYLDAVYNHVSCIYPTHGKTGWNYMPFTLSVHVPLRQMLKNTGVKAGDKLEIGAVAVPEYYEESPGKALTKERLTSLIEDGTLGVGSYMTTIVTLDNDAPTIENDEIKVSQDNKSISFKVKDDQHIAHVGLYNTDGKRVYDSKSPKDENGEYDCTLSAAYLQAGGEYSLVVGDFAGNMRMYRFTYGDKLNYQESKYTIAYVRTGGDGILTGTWVAIEPPKLNYSSYSTTYNGVTPLCYAGNTEVLAGADAAGDYLWQVFENGLLYVSKITDLTAKTLIADISSAGIGIVRDLAFNESDKKLYAVDGGDTVWQIDPMTGETKSAGKITLADGKTPQLYGLAMGKNGNGYATCYDGSQNSLLKLTLADGTVTAEAMSGSLSTVKGQYVSLAWTDADKTALYASSAGNLGAATYSNYVYKITITDSGYSAAKANTSSVVLHVVRGLVNLSAKPEFTPGSGEITGITICNSKDTMYEGDTVDLKAAFNPWNAPGNLSEISWSSSDEQTVSVSQDGKLTALKPGKATVKASYTKDEMIYSSFEITVKEAPKIALAALLREGNGEYYFESFNAADPSTRKKVSGPQQNYIVGTMNLAGDCLYVRSSGYGFRVNPKDFSVTQAGSSFQAGMNSGDAAHCKRSGYYTQFGYVTLIGHTVYMFGGDMYSHGSFDQFNSVGKRFSMCDVDLPASQATICYAKYLENYSYELDGEQLTKPADLYYVLTEDGSLCKLIFYDDYKAKTENLGKVEGVSLPGVAAMNEESTASMIYDEGTGYLAVISKIRQNTAKVQVIDPENCKVVIEREFEQELRQVGILYQYDYSGFPEYSEQTAVTAHLSDNAALNKETKTVTVEVPLNTTNGLTELSFNPDLLTFKEATSDLLYYSAHAENGKVKFAFANDEAVEQNAKFIFNYEPQAAEKTTQIEVAEKEKGNPEENLQLQTHSENVTLPADPAKRVLTSITLSGEYKTDYLEGDKALDTTGLIVTANYSDGDQVTLSPGDYTLSDFANTPGEHIITVTYQDKTATFKINVKAKSPQTLEVAVSPKTEYIEGTQFDDTGMQLTVHYNNGTSQTVTSGWEIGEYDFAAPGVTHVPITYMGLTVKLQVTVKPKSTVSIAVTHNPNKVTYVQGEEFDPAGMQVTVHFDNGKTEVITTGWEITYDFTTPGEKIVTVSFGGESAAFTVTVAQKQPIVSQPDVSQPETSQPETSQPSESQPSESQPSESQPSESQPSESQPSESQPSGSQPSSGSSSAPTASGSPATGPATEIPLLLLLLSSTALLAVTVRVKRN